MKRLIYAVLALAFAGAIWFAVSAVGNGSRRVATPGGEADGDAELARSTGLEFEDSTLAQTQTSTSNAPGAAERQTPTTPAQPHATTGIPRLHGLVVNSRGEPVRDALVRLRYEPTRAELRGQHTLTDGTFEAKLAGSGTYRVLATHADFGAAIAQVRTADRPDPLIMRLVGLENIIGQVHDSQGNAIPFLPLVITRELDEPNEDPDVLEWEGRGVSLQLVCTDAEGAFVATELRAGRYSVTTRLESTPAASELTEQPHPTGRPPLELICDVPVLAVYAPHLKPLETVSNVRMPSDAFRLTQSRLYVTHAARERSETNLRRRVNLSSCGTASARDRAHGLLGPDGARIFFPEPDTPLHVSLLGGDRPAYSTTVTLAHDAGRLTLVIDAPVAGPLATLVIAGATRLAHSVNVRLVDPTSGRAVAGFRLEKNGERGELSAPPGTYELHIAPLFPARAADPAQAPNDVVVRQMIELTASETFAFELPLHADIDPSVPAYPR